MNGLLMSGKNSNRGCLRGKCWKKFGAKERGGNREMEKITERTLTNFWQEYYAE
jgi:hypothetical protein